MKIWLFILTSFLLQNSSLMASDINYANKLQTTIRISTTVAKYQDIARAKALRNLSMLLHSEVSGNILLSDNLKQTSNHEIYKTDYKSTSNIKYNIEIVRPFEKHRYIVGDIYVLTMYIDFNISGPIYAKLANEERIFINDIYKSYEHVDTDYDKVKLLKKIKKHYIKFSIYQQTSLIMGFGVQKNPLISIFQVDLYLEELKENIYLKEPIHYDGYTIR